MNAFSKTSIGGYNIVNHTYDVVVVGAGGSGLRATPGRGGAENGMHNKGIPNTHHTVAAQGGISAALGNMAKDDWRWHITIP